MHPPIFVVDHRIGLGPAPVDDRHRDRFIPRRHRPAHLVIGPDPHAALSGPAMAVIPEVPKPEAQRALLIALAQDPRFSRNVAAPVKAGPRVRLGQALMALGWWLVRQDRQHS